ncbi:MAG TPA: Uma2 family endonuclease [Isosphaeraceae bacterium]
MATAVPKKRYTPQEYLALERRAETKSEFFDGEIFAMADVSREHNRIALNLASWLNTQFGDGRCEAYMADMRVRVDRTGLYTYPDVIAVCGEPRFEDAEVDTLLNPTLIVEVLSPSTERYDRGKNFGHYQRIESLREYVLVSQDAVFVERFTRQDGGWLLTSYLSRDDVVALESVGIQVPLKDVYARVDVHEGEEGLGHGPPSDVEAPRNPR